MKADCKDTQRLIETLRSYDWVPKGTPRLFHKVPAIMAEAADALEAKNQEIEGLEGVVELAAERNQELIERIEGLEAEIKEHVDAYQECLKRSMGLEAALQGHYCDRLERGTACIICDALGEKDGISS